MVNVKCDFCDATAHGTIDVLVGKGWQQAKIDMTVGNKRKKKTITACKDHKNNFLKEVQNAFKRIFEKEGGAQRRL